MWANLGAHRCQVESGGVGVEATRTTDADGFPASRRATVHGVARAARPDLAGRSLLHLQCHFGMDTLSMARMGARVTGMDFSEEAIGLARSLAEELGLEARFIQSNLYALTRVLHEQFDVVFTSY